MNNHQVDTLIKSIQTQVSMILLYAEFFYHTPISIVDRDFKGQVDIICFNIDISCGAGIGIDHQMIFLLCDIFNSDIITSVCSQVTTDRITMSII